MMDALFGGGYTAFKVVFAVIVVLGLLALAFWALRRFGGERLRGAGTRGRQPRLAVIDQAAVDGRRRLVLVRRDNVEHLLIIGGPTDVVVEQNIVRAAPPRDAVPARPAAAAGAADTLPRPVPLEGSTWPLQPEPALRVEPRSEPAARPQRPAAEGAWPAESEPPPAPPVRERRARSTEALAGLAEELSRVTPAPEATGSERQGERQVARRPVRPQPAGQSADPAPKAPADQNLTEMAQRLEAALRRPAKGLEKNPETSADKGDDPAEAAKAAPEAASEAAPSPPAHAVAAAETARPVRAASAQADGKPKSLYADLEQEMASLLGRPGGKP